MTALAALACAGWMPGCVARDPLRIASHVWPGYEFMFMARNMGWLPPDQIHLSETPAATDSIHALNARLVDGAALTLDEVLRVRAGGVPLTVVAVFDISAGADVLLARPAIPRLQDLAGKTVAVEHSALGAFMLSNALHAAGLAPQAVNVVHATVDQHERVWAEGRVDAIVSYPPYSDRLEKTGAVRLFDSRSLPDGILDVLAVNPQALSEQKEALQLLVDAHFRALQHFRNNPRDATYRLGARLSMPAGEVMRTYRGLALPDRDENRRLLGGPRPALRSTAQHLSRTMVEAGLLDALDDLSGLISPELLGEAA